ncbi:sodium/proton antiporter, NhaA family [Nitrosovibrio sp. Nv17]|nr:sodium/proton antiporter, NhaA family [Nitrosovibrio sp. Nv17]
MDERAFARLERLLHREAVSGVMLLVAAAIALIWANSPLAYGYHALWHTPFSIGPGGILFSQPLHFWINDALMTVFFLVVGMEVRREIHEGALAHPRQAALPVAAAMGGVVVPALIYLGINPDPARQYGWAVPTATDIAFAVGVLALLGRAIPGTVRVLLLALVVIDDIIAVLIIACCYSGGLDPGGFAVAGAGILMVLGLQRMGSGSAWAYVAPGTILWGGLLMTGAHPALAGVVLGFMTPVRPLRMREGRLEMMARIAHELPGHGAGTAQDATRWESLPPVVRVQRALRPWVACGVMPLFALANAGVSLGGIDPSAGGAGWATAGVALALVAGKPLGVIGASWLVVRMGWCRLPPGVSWSGMVLVGLLAGIGFTMSIFIAMLAFDDANLLGAAKLGVLMGSLAAALLGLGWGMVYARRLRSEAARGAAA